MHTTKTPISLGIRPVWSEPSLCIQCIAKDPSFLHADSEDFVQTGRMPRLIWVFAWPIAILLVLSWGGSVIIVFFLLSVRRDRGRVWTQTKWMSQQTNMTSDYLSWDIYVALSVIHTAVITRPYPYEAFSRDRVNYSSIRPKWNDSHCSPGPQHLYSCFLFVIFIDLFPFCFLTPLKYLLSSTFLQKPHIRTSPVKTIKPQLFPQLK